MRVVGEERAGGAVGEGEIGDHGAGTAMVEPGPGFGEGGYHADFAGEAIQGGGENVRVTFTVLDHENGDWLFHQPCASKGKTRDVTMSDARDKRKG